MASNTPLPTFQRYVNGAPLPSSNRRSFRPLEKYLMFLVLFTVGLVFFGAFFYLPEFKTSASQTGSKIYEHIQKAPELFQAPAPVDHLGLALVHHDLNKPDPHVLSDQERLRRKIFEDEQSKKVLERPNIGNNERSSSSSINTIVPQESPIKPSALVKPESNVALFTISDEEDPDPDIRMKRETVKKMMKHAWDNYVTYAWGKNELKPLSRRGHSGSIFGSAELGMSIIDGLDTLYIMGLTDEYENGKKWVAESLTFDDKKIELSVFETTIRFIGAILTLYSFTGDPMYRDKAVHIADKMLPAFKTPTGIPNALINVYNGDSKNYAWASGSSSILSELGTLHLEFAYLSDVTGNPIYREKVDKIRAVISNIDKPNGLYPNYLNPKTGRWGQSHISIGALGDSFYEYLLKAWIQSGREDTEGLKLFDDAMDALMTHTLRRSQKKNLMYFSDMKLDRLEHKMDHLACFSGGMFGLAAHTRPESDVYSKYMDVAKGITNTCHEAYIQTATHIGPESFKFTDTLEAKAYRSQDKYYILRPEVVESYFYLWRITKDPKYRDWAWDYVQALEKHCRTEYGYTGIKNVYQENPQQDDVQQSFFLAETLKYLYLIFSDDFLLSLDQWVFNSEGHPLPVKGKNEFYRPAATAGAAPVSS